MGVVVVAIILSTFMALYVSGLISKPLAMLSTFMRKAGSTGDIAFTADDVKNIDMYAKVKDEIGQTIADSISFVNHVTNIARELESVADGDLTAEIVSLSEKDIMGHSLKKMTDNLNNMFTEIQSATTQVSTGSTQVASGAQSLAQGSTEQAASVEELSSAITEIEEGTKANALTANKASALSVMIKENAEKGSRQMDEMITAVGEINEASKNINGIIKTIDDIAFQTNILALNAAVEAARAGQHGRGFAVVAEEVRNLASKSAEAARDTSDMIQNSMDKAELGARIAGDTAASLKKIVSGIDESSQLIAEIAKGSEEQFSGISQINMGIDQVTQVVQLNSATAEESAAASEELSGQSMVLRELVSQFKLKDGSVMHQRLPSTNAPTPKRLAMHDKDGFALTASSGDLGKY
jgi:methyl-accepting chemotaxis protein